MKNSNIGIFWNERKGVKNKSRRGNRQQSRAEVTVQEGLRIYCTICAAGRVKERRLRVSAPSRSDLEWADTVTVKVSELLRAEG